MFVLTYSSVHPPQPFPESTKAIGADVGLENLITLRNGVSIPNPRFYERAQAKLRRLQRRVSRRQKMCALGAVEHQAETTCRLR